MRFLPVISRELAVASRGPRLYWVRFLAAAAAIGLVTWVWLTFGDAVPSDVRARQLFMALSGLGFIYALFAGFMLTADVISEEKREGTLGLLFLTDLRGWEVVLGKLFSSSLRAVYGLVAIFPVMSLPLLLGGISYGEVARMAVVLLNTLWFSLTIGLLVSALSKSDRKSLFAAFSIILFFTAAWPILAIVGARWMGLTSSFFYDAVSPAFSFTYAFEQSYLRAAAAFWKSIFVVHALGWISLLGAGWIVPRVWQDKARTGLRLKWNLAMQRLRNGAPGQKERYRSQLLNINPYYWLASRDRVKPALLASFLGLFGLFWFLLYLRHRGGMLDQAAFLITALMLHTVLKVWLCAESGRLFAEDKRSGALELTLSTPLTTREIIEGQLLGLLRQFGLAAGVILLADIIMMVLGARAHSGDIDWVALSFAGILVLIMDLVTIPIVGMWLGLTMRNAGRAALLTAFYILVLPWILLIAFMTFVALVRMSGIDSITFFIGSYFAISLLIDLCFITWASGNLLTRFRQAATHKHGSARS